MIGTDGTIFYSSNTDQATGKAPGHIYAVNPDGTQKWSIAIDPLIFTSVAMGPDGTLYEGTLTGKLFAIH